MNCTVDVKRARHITVGYDDQLNALIALKFYADHLKANDLLDLADKYMESHENLSEAWVRGLPAKEIT